MDDKAFVEKLAADIASNGGRAYYVGGYVRDQILQRENKDIDIEVHGITPDDLMSVLRRYGSVDLQGKSFGVYRVGKYDVDISQPRRERKIGEKHTDFTVEVDPFMGVKEAAKRRDFTINAIMQDVLTKEIIDPFNGKTDLQNGWIRHVNDDTFAEDSLRVLRAAQFAARFHFDICPETKELMKTLSLSELPRERINEEMKKAFLKSDKPSVFFEALRQTNQLDVWFPEVKALINCPQNEFYYPEGDVYTHTMMVIDSLAKQKNRAKYPYELILSGLCHDFGKPATLSYNEAKGVHQNIGHPAAGVEIAKAFLDRIVHDNGIRDFVLESVKNHDDPLKYYNGNSKLRKTNLFFDSLKYPEELILLTCADRTTSPAEEVEQYRSWLTDRLDAYKARMEEPQVLGRDLIEIGLSPSPEFSEILEDAHKRHLNYEEKDVILRSIKKKHNIEKKELPAIRELLKEQEEDLEIE